MTFPLALAAIGTHLTAAGAALTNPITDVAGAHPVPRGSRCIRYWYAGEYDPTSKLGGSSTFTDRMVGFRVQIMAWWQLSSGAEVLSAAVDAEAYELTYQINSRLLGDSQLGGQCVDLVVNYAEVTFTGLQGGAYRTLEIEVVPVFVDLYPIAP